MLLDDNLVGITSMVYIYIYTVFAIYRTLINRILLCSLQPIVIYCNIFILSYKSTRKLLLLCLC